MATVGVRFRPSDRLVYVDDASLDLKVGDRVLIESPEWGENQIEATVAVGSGQVIFSELPGTQGAVLSVVTRAQP